MFFKRGYWLIGILLFAFAGVLSACSNESRPERNIVDVNLKGGSTACMDDMSTEMSDYLDGHASAAQVHQFWGCTQSTLSDFMQLTRGTQPDRYSSQELKTFLEVYFLKNRPIPDELVLQLMRIKQLLVSGSDQEITRNEIRQIFNLIHVLEPLTIQLGPYIQVLRRPSAATPEQLDEAIQSMSAVFVRMGSWLDQNHKDYSFSDLRALLTQIQQTLDLPESGPLTFLRDQLDIVEQAKLILIGAPADRISGEQWPQLLRVANQLAVTVLHLAQVQKNADNDWTQILASPQLVNVARGCLDMLAESVHRQPDHRLAVNSLTPLFQTMASKSWWPTELSPESLTGAVSYVVGRFLSRPAVPAAETLTDENLQNFKLFLDQWSDLLSRISQGQALPDDFQKAYGLNYPLDLDHKGRLLYPRVKQTLQPDTATIQQFANLYMLVQFVGQGYGDWPLNGETLTTAAEEVLSVLHSFGWLMSTDASIVHRLAMEANLFLPDSDGNGALNSGEAFQYLLVVLSSYRTELNACSKASQCSWDLIYKNRADVFSMMPRLLTSGLTQADWMDLFQSVEAVVGSQQWLMSFVVFHYIEDFMTLYDADISGTINLTEAMSAYPIFQPILGQLLSNAGVPPDDVLVFYTYLMKYGETPFTQFGGAVRFLYWKWHRDHWAFEADRTTLARILAQLSQL